MATGYSLDALSKVIVLKEDVVGYTAPAPDLYLPLISDLRIEEGFGDPDRIDVSAAQDGSVMVDLPSRSVSFSRASTATYINKSGVLTIAEVNEPRFEKDGLLIESSSTNFCKYSDSSTNLPEYKLGRCSISAHSTGGIKASLDKSEISRWFSFLSRDVSGSTPETHTGSFYFKDSDQDSLDAIIYIELFYSNQDGSGDYMSFRVTPPIEGFKVGKRYEVTGTPNENWQNPEVRLNVGNDSEKDFNITLHRLQIEKLPYATSYIPTESAAVTRASDTVKIRADNVAKQGQEMTIACECNPINTEYLSPILGGLDGNSSFKDCRFYFQYNQLRFHPTNEPTLRAYLPISKPERMMCASVQTENTAQVFVNGAASEKIDYLTTTGNYTPEYYVGGYSNFGQRLNGHIRDLRIWNRALTNEQVSTLGAA